MEAFNLEVIAMTRRFSCSVWDGAAQVFHMKMGMKEIKNLFHNFSQKLGGHGL